MILSTSTDPSSEESFALVENGLNANHVSVFVGSMRYKNIKYYAVWDPHGSLNEDTPDHTKTKFNLISKNLNNINKIPGADSGVAFLTLDQMKQFFVQATVCESFF